MRRNYSVVSGGSLVLLAAACSAMALNDGLARTPPMGWNPWTVFKSSISETVFKQIADSMKSKGLLAAGYQYMNIDGGGSYPSGQQALASYVHGKGFKFGVYGNDVNNHIPTAEASWATKWAGWGADYVKYDCYNTSIKDPTWVAMRNALAATGRPMVYTCHASDGEPVQADTIAHMFRTGADIQTNNESPSFTKVMANLGNNNGQAFRAKPGYWNDPDFLLVGIPNGLTLQEQRTQFGLWALSAAPLLIACDVRSVSSASLDILLNSEIIAVDQDSLGYQGKLVRPMGSLLIWSKNLAGGGRAVALYNGTTADAGITVRWTDVGLAGTVKVRNLWTHQDLGNVPDSLTLTVAGHDCAMLKITPLPSAVLSVRKDGNARAAPCGRLVAIQRGPFAAETFDIRGCFLQRESSRPPSFPLPGIILVTRSPSE